jgi:hypothetical protein
MMELDDTDYSKEQYIGEDAFELVAVPKIQVRERKGLMKSLWKQGLILKDIIRSKPVPEGGT